jgi:hypothetical protein
VPWLDTWLTPVNSVNWNWASGNNDTGIRIFVTSGSNSVFLNSAEGNRNNDLEDYDVSCGSNNWFSNVFNVSNPSTCIH